jgi:hypothetical protein
MKEIISVDVLPEKTSIDVYGALTTDAPPLQLRGTVRLQLARAAKFKALTYVIFSYGSYVFVQCPNQFHCL